MTSPVRVRLRRLDREGASYKGYCVLMVSNSQGVSNDITCEGPFAKAR